MKQHIVSKCYLKSWCDPSCPPGHTPYIWLIAADGSTKTKRAPHKSLTQTDAFTITFPGGQKDLRVESTLNRLEAEFVNIAAKIAKRGTLTDRDRVYLLAFMATMHTRTDPFANAMWTSWSHIGSQVRQLEKIIESGRALPPPSTISLPGEKSTPITSRDIDDILQNGRAYGVELALKEIVPMLWRMNIAFLVAPKGSFFLTSDNPCVWCNPEADRMPLFYRGAGLAMKNIEVTMPISPQIVILMSHKSADRGDGQPDVTGYIPIPDSTVQEMNRRTIIYCGERFVSITSEAKASWFESGPIPPDAWENRHPEMLRGHSKE